RGEDLLNEIREPVLLQLGTSMNRCLNQLVAVLECGRDSGQFAVDDPLLLANVLYNQALGGLNLVRLELTVRETVPGLPAVDHISFESVKIHIIRAAVAMARGGPQHYFMLREWQQLPARRRRRSKSARARTPFREVVSPGSQRPVGRWPLTADRG